MKIFLSYNFADMDFVAQVDAFLRTQQPDIDTYCWTEDQRGYGFIAELKAALAKSDAFVYFNGAVRGDTQQDELSLAKTLSTQEHMLFVWLPVNDGFTGHAANPIKIAEPSRAAALECAKSIVKALGKRFLPPYGIPFGYPFGYEKAIVEAHVSGDYIQRKVLDGCPAEWPRVDKVERSEARVKNPHQH